MGDKDALRPDLEPSGAWPEHPDDQPVPGVEWLGSVGHDELESRKRLVEEVEGRPSPVTEAWAAEAEQRLRVGKEGALPALERRNWAEQVERERADRDEWRERALAAEARLAELEGG